VLPRTDGKDPSGTTPAELQADEGARLAHSLPELAEFYRALQALRDGRRAEPLRVTWLGDSHTAADFMPQRLRERLWAAAGPGGPGFVRLGMDSYRHGVAVFERSGRWRKQPILPAQRTRVMDGVFGYGGIRTIPLSGGS